MSAKTKKVTNKSTLPKAVTKVAHPLLADVWELILQAREGVARAVDSGLTTRNGMWVVACGRTSSRKSGPSVVIT